MHCKHFVCLFHTQCMNLMFNVSAQQGVIKTEFFWVIELQGKIVAVPLSLLAIKTPEIILE